MKPHEEHIASIPWVARISEKRPCQGVKWAEIGLKHLYSMGGKPPEGIPDRAKCKLNAKWHFEALPDTFRGASGLIGKTGDYCAWHLSTQFHNPDEEARYEEWLKKMRSLYAPKGVSLEEQRNYGQQLVNNGTEEEVVVHAHGTDGQCSEDCRNYPDVRGSGVGPDEGTDTPE